MVTVGPAARLRAFVAKKGLTTKALASEVGCSQPTAWRLLAGRIQPSLNVATAIERITEGAIRAVDWAEFEQEAAR